MTSTKTKTAISLITAVILSAAIATIIVKAVTAHSLHNPSWAKDSSHWETSSTTLEKNPPAFILRPTRFPNDRGGVTVGDERGNVKILQKNATLQSLLASAYDASELRMVLPAGLPEEHFDLMLTLPTHGREALQKEIRTRFGLTAQRETRDTDVLILKVKYPSAPGLQVSQSGRGSWTGGPQEIVIKHQRFNGFADSLERRLGEPVINQTGLNGFYDIHLQWQADSDENEKATLEKAILNQLGLELVPATMPMETLVVEKRS